MTAPCGKKHWGEGDLIFIVVRMAEVEIQGLDLSGFIPVTGKAAGAAGVPRINLLILSSSLLSVDQDLLL